MHYLRPSSLPSKRRITMGWIITAFTLTKECVTPRTSPTRWAAILDWLWSLNSWWQWLVQKGFKLLYYIRGRKIEFHDRVPKLLNSGFRRWLGTYSRLRMVFLDCPTDKEKKRTVFDTAKALQWTKGRKELAKLNINLNHNHLAKPEVLLQSECYIPYIDSGFLHSFLMIW